MFVILIPVPQSGKIIVICVVWIVWVWEWYRSHVLWETLAGTFSLGTVCSGPAAIDRTTTVSRLRGHFPRHSSLFAQTPSPSSSRRGGPRNMSCGIPFFSLLRNYFSSFTHPRT